MRVRKLIFLMGILEATLISTENGIETERNHRSRVGLKIFEKTFGRHENNFMMAAAAVSARARPRACFV